MSEIKFSINELVEITEKMPLALRHSIILTLFPTEDSKDAIAIILRFANKQIKKMTFINAILTWNWDYPPNKDDAILTLIEETFEEYRKEVK